MPSAYQAVLFDHDGTLADSEHMYYQTERDLLSRDYGFDLTWELYERELLGKANSSALVFHRELGLQTPQQIDSLHRQIIRALEQAASTAEALYTPGAEEFLSWLDERSIPWAVVTSANRAQILGLHRSTGLVERSSALVTFDDISQPKPDPEPYLLGAKLLGISPEQCIAVEDSQTGFLAAQQAGCQTFRVGHGHIPHPEAWSQIRSLLSS